MSELKPTYKQPIKAIHKWKVDQEGQPIEALFTRHVWGRMPTAKYDGKNYTRMGWKLVDEHENGKTGSSKPKAKTPPEAKGLDPKLEAKVKDAVKADNQRGVTIQDIKDYASAKNFEIDTAQSKADIFNELKEIVKADI